MYNKTTSALFTLSRRTAKLFGVLLTIGVAACGNSGNSGTNPNMDMDNTQPLPEETGMLAGITAAHNQARANFMPAATTPIPNLTWSADVAAVAQAWAANCMFTHNINAAYNY